MVNISDALLVVVIVLAVLLFIVIIAAIAIFFSWRKRTQRETALVDGTNNGESEESTPCTDPFTVEPMFGNVKAPKIDNLATYAKLEEVPAYISLAIYLCSIVIVGS